jgi:hypothetical protein
MPKKYGSTKLFVSSIFKFSADRLDSDAPEQHSSRVRWRKMAVHFFNKMSDADSPRSESPVVRRRSSRLASKTTTSSVSSPYVSSSYSRPRRSKKSVDPKHSDHDSESEPAQPGQPDAKELKPESSKSQKIDSDSDAELADNFSTAKASLEKVKQIDARIAELESEEVSFRTLMKGNRRSVLFSFY